MNVAKTLTAAQLVIRLLRHTPKLKDLAAELSAHAGQHVWRQQLTRWLSGKGISPSNRVLLVNYLNRTRTKA